RQIKVGYIDCSDAGQGQWHVIRSVIELVGRHRQSVGDEPALSERGVHKRPQIVIAFLADISELETIWRVSTAERLGNDVLQRGLLGEMCAVAVQTHESFDHGLPWAGTWLLSESTAACRGCSGVIALARSVIGQQRSLAVPVIAKPD